MVGGSGALPEGAGASGGVHGDGGLPPADHGGEARYPPPTHDGHHHHSSISSPIQAQAHPAQGHTASAPATPLAPPKPRNALPRGLACVPCRQKKLKCTGERPACAQCIAAAKRVRALLSSAIHGVGPDGERVDKRGRKRKAVSSEDVLECRYEGDAEGGKGGKGPAAAAAAAAAAAGVGGAGQVQQAKWQTLAPAKVEIMTTTAAPSARKPGMGMGAAPPVRVDSPGMPAAPGDLPPIGRLAGLCAENEYGAALDSALGQPRGSLVHAPQPASVHARSQSQASWLHGAQATYGDSAPLDAPYAASSDNERGRSESIPLRAGYADIPQAHAYASALPPLDPKHGLPAGAAPTGWPASRPAYLDAMRDAPVDAFPAYAPPADPHWLSPPASQGSHGAASASGSAPVKTALPMPQMPTDRFVVQPPLGAWELNAMVLPHGEVDVMPGSPLEYAL